MPTSYNQPRLCGRCYLGNIEVGASESLPCSSETPVNFGACCFVKQRPAVGSNVFSKRRVRVESGTHPAREGSNIASTFHRGRRSGKLRLTLHHVLAFER